MIAKLATKNRFLSFHTVWATSGHKKPRHQDGELIVGGTSPE